MQFQVPSSQQPNSVVQSILEAKNRCIQLLRVALKATMWGNIVTVRVNLYTFFYRFLVILILPFSLEKQLTVTQEMVNAATQHNSTPCLQAQQALELLLFLFEVMVLRHFQNILIKV